MTSINRKPSYQKKKGKHNTCIKAEQRAQHCKYYRYQTDMMGTS
jgi:hypothetical protein